MHGKFLRFALACLLVPTQALAAFSYQDVVTKAKNMAATAYKAPEPVPKFMRELGFHDYQNIRSNPDKSLWRESNPNFQGMLPPPGLFYSHPVTSKVVDSPGARCVGFPKGYVDLADAEL